MEQSSSYLSFMLPKKLWVKQRRKVNRRDLIKKCSILWSKIVRGKHGGLCALCGSKWDVQAHHIVRKGTSIHAGWFLLCNGIPLCRHCHYEGIHALNFNTVKVYQKRIEDYVIRNGMTYETLYDACKVTKCKYDTARISTIYNDLLGFKNSNLTSFSTYSSSI